MGGVARRATAIKQARADAGGAVLTVDAGNSLFGQMVALRSEGRAVVEAMNAMRYDAMAVGDLDLAGGASTLLARAEDARFAVVSCNLVDPADGELLLPPYAIVERRGITFGIIGVTDTDATWAPTISETLTVLDPVESVRRHLPEVRARSDLVVVLSRLGLEGDRALAEAVPGIAVIVGGPSRKLLKPPEIAGDTVIVQMGYDGQRLGRLDGTLDERGYLRDPEVTIVSLGPSVPDDARLAALVKKYHAAYPAPTVPAH